MDQLVAHQRAQDAFAAVLANVKPDHLSAPTPCTEWNAQALIDHVVGGNQWVVSLAGGEAAQLPTGVGAAHAASAAAAQAAFAGPEGLTRIYELPFGKVPGTTFIGLRTSDVLTHAWDLAKATGQPTDLDPELATEALAASQARIAPAFRGPGMPFAEEQPCPDGRSAADALAAFLGRPLD